MGQVTDVAVTWEEPKGPPLLGFFALGLDRFQKTCKLLACRISVYFGGTGSGV